MTMNNNTRHWQLVDTGLSMLRIPGGWLYRHELSGTIAFVPFDVVERDPFSATIPDEL